MPEKDIIEIANAANMIVQGYAFTKKNGNISVLNLKRPTRAMVISQVCMHMQVINGLQKQVLRSSL